MSEFFKAELKDRFLEYASDRDDFFEVRLLYDEFLRPNYSLEYVERLVKDIIEFDSSLLDVMSGNGTNYFMVSGTDQTVDFLEEGGFTDLFIKEEEKWDNFLEHFSYNVKATSRESASMEKLKKPTPRKEKRLLLLLIGAVVVSFAFTIYSLVKSAFEEKEYITKEELQNAMQELRSKPQDKKEQGFDLSAEKMVEEPDSIPTKVAK